MEKNNLQNDEFEIQVFGFSSKEFIGDFKNRIKEDVSDILKAFEAKLHEKGKVGDDAELIKEEMKKLLNEYMAVRDEVMSVAEPEIKQFFSIPKGAIPHLDWKQRYDNPADENIEDLENEIKDLEEQLIKEQMFQQLCNEELEQLKQLDPVCEQVEATLNKEINFENKSIPAKTEKLLKVYDECIRKMTIECPEGVNSILKHARLFE